MFEITVLDSSDRRGSATQAQALFAEAPSGLQRRLAAAERRKMEQDARAESPRRPDKRGRRQIIDFNRGRE